MLTKRQIKQMRKNIWKARRVQYGLVQDSKTTEQRMRRYEVCIWFEKIDVLLSVILEESETEDAPFWWIGQFTMPSGKGWLDFIYNKDKKENK